MAENLPDEILSEILSPVLKVAETKFSDTSATSPFASYSSSSSAVLVVCKAWLRVSTPLHYNVVVLRSKAQAGALAAALERNNDLGRFIKKLRVEGGFGKHMGIILRHAPNVTDLFVSGMVHSPDTASALALGLPRLNPTRLIVFEDPEHLLKNKSVVQLFEGLTKAINGWTKLTTLILSHDFRGGPVREAFLEAICSSKTLEIVSVPSRCGFPTMKKFAAIKSLKAIEIRATTRNVGSHYVDRVNAESILKPLIRFAEEPPKRKKTTAVAADIILPPTNPTFRSMASEPQEVVDNVWKRILAFAMLEVEPVSPREINLDDWDEYFRPNEINANRLAFALVSKTFHRLAIPYLYAYPEFRSNISVEKFAERLVTEPSLGPHVRELSRHHAAGFGFGEDSRRVTPHFIPIFSRTPGLTRLTGHSTDDFSISGGFSIAFEAFEALAETAGGTLAEFRGLEIEREEEDPFDWEQSFSPVRHQPTIFTLFTALRVLRWDSRVDFELPSACGMAEHCCSEVLPALEVLEVDSHKILAVFEEFGLKSLRSLTFKFWTGPEGCASASFLRRHGHKLTHFKLNSAALDGMPIFALCPTLAELELILIGRHCTHTRPGDARDAEYYPPTLAFPSGHQGLVKLLVRKDEPRSKTESQTEWKRFLGDSDWTNFPALQEIRASPLEWPMTEHAISKSPWVKAAELLAKQHNIKLTDKKGVPWRPRLKGSRR
ncbi:hypothetical protein C8J57DRAFT_1305852 [Mycena rebaudengoi]|nr:hypothetical protein C8J57DRAFT_1305852 [Mycena rebaudengoi]